MAALDTQYPCIKFTVEWVSENSLSFLDAEVIRFHNSIKLALYRKPTHSGQYLHFYSWHSIKVKRSVIFSLLLREFRLYDQRYLNHEIDYLKTKFRSLGYLSNVKRKFFSPPSSTPNNSNDRKPTISLSSNKFSTFLAYIHL